MLRYLYLFQVTEKHQHKEKELSFSMVLRRNEQEEIKLWEHSGRKGQGNNEHVHLRPTRARLETRQKWLFTSSAFRERKNAKKRRTGNQKVELRAFCNYHRLTRHKQGLQCHPCLDIPCLLTHSPARENVIDIQK